MEPAVFYSSNGIGRFFLISSLIASFLSTVTGIIASHSNSTKALEVSCKSTKLVFVFILFASLTLAISLATDNFEVNYVARFSNQDMPLAYKLSAFWAGFEGSMLFWCLTLSLGGALMASIWKEQKIPFALCLYNLSVIFFIFLTFFYSNPFKLAYPVTPPSDGVGLNPLLQNEFMAIHPPLIYIGLSFFTIPFSTYIGGVLSKKISIALVRKWNLISWYFLTAGNALGSYWAYSELGWGGFWAWDPVESASLLPWLSSTSLLHSLIAEEKKGALKAWNYWLVSCTYLLVIFEVLITRTGLVQSLHAFSGSDLEITFSVYLAILILFLVILFFRKRKLWFSSSPVERLFSKEGIFLVNNFVFSSLCLIIIYGICFPFFSKIIYDQPRTFGISYYNRATSPFFATLIFLTGLSFIRLNSLNLRLVKRSLIVGVVFLSLAFFLSHNGIYNSNAVFLYTLCGFSFLLFLRSAFSGELFTGNRKFGIVLVHIGVLISAMGIISSTLLQKSQDLTLRRDETASLYGYSVLLEDFKIYIARNHEAFAIVLNVRDSQNGTFIASLSPETRFFYKAGITTSEAAIHSTFGQDFYVAFLGLEEDGESANLRILIKPLQIWLWIGIVVILIGSASSLAFGFGKNKKGNGTSPYLK